MQDALGDFGDDYYFLFNCPGQIELYTHMPVMRTIAQALQEWGYVEEKRSEDACPVYEVLCAARGAVCGVWCVVCGVWCDACGTVCVDHKS